MDDLQLANSIMERLDQLATYSEEPDRLTRRVATPALEQAMQAVAAWMRAAGMDVRRDNVGNLIGRYAAATTDAPTLLLGSHLDSVRDAGKYDGPLGVMVALGCVERLAADGRRLPFALEVVAFADEEGLRFHTAYLGSAVVAGTFDPAWLALVDADGMSLGAALEAIGLEPAAVARDARSRADLLGYVEVHIEQGPVLEAQALPVGVVSGIAGQSRIAVRFDGMAGHAGTVPMALRQDALAGAAEFVLAVEALALKTPALVATVGQLAVTPGASNVIAGRAALSLDVRHAEDSVRAAAVERLQLEAERITRRRSLTLDWAPAQQNGSTLCDPRLTALLGDAVVAQGTAALALTSGAGHDGVMLARLCPIAMLFVRCAGGISHNPAEAVLTEDVAVALQVLSDFIGRLAQETTHDAV